MNDPNTHEAPLSLLSAFYAIIAWITLKEVQVILTIIATIVSIVAGSFAIYSSYLKIRSRKTPESPTPNS